LCGERRGGHADLFRTNVLHGIQNSVGESEREKSLLRDLCFVGEKYGGSLECF